MTRNENLASFLRVIDFFLPCQPSQCLVGYHVPFPQQLRQPQDVDLRRLLQQRPDPSGALLDLFLHVPPLRFPGSSTGRSRRPNLARVKARISTRYHRKNDFLVEGIRHLPFPLRELVFNCVVDKLCIALEVELGENPGPIGADCRWAEAEVSGYFLDLPPRGDHPHDLELPI